MTKAPNHFIFGKLFQKNMLISPFLKAKFAGKPDGQKSYFLKVQSKML